MYAKPTFIGLLSLLALLPFGCKEEEAPYYPPPASPEPEQVIGQAESWVTNGAQTKLLQKEVKTDILPLGQTKEHSIAINFSESLQEIEGFGAALTGSSAYLIHQLSPAQRTDLLKKLFDTEQGIGLSYLRLTMGASDFSLQDYTYNDLPAGQSDPELQQFSIAAEGEHLLPVLQEIRSVAPDIKLMASPWSAPAWMKTSGKLAGGKLKSEWYASYAQYFVRYIRAMEVAAQPIDAITVQNEPLHEAAYPSMRMEAAEQADFIKNHLGPAFQEAGISSKIIIYDHNFDRVDYPLEVLSDPLVKQYVAGTAFHAYAGTASAMGQLQATHPELGLYFTEISGGGWATNFSDNLQWNMSNIFIGTSRYGAKTALLWNLALNENNGPKNGGCDNCRGVVTLTSAGEIRRNVEYYALAHLARFVRPGAYRVQSEEFGSGSQLESVAFRNPDGSKVVVLLNKGEEAKTFSLTFNEQMIHYILEGKAVASLRWE